jgi:DNA-binding IclR family transcriptional regulator
MPSHRRRRADPAADRGTQPEPAGANPATATRGPDRASSPKWRRHRENSADGRSVTSKLAAILRTFSTGSVHSLSDIARSANLPVSTAHRPATELMEWGFLERTEDERYRVGPLLTHIGSRVWHEPNVQEHARRVFDDLSSATHATVRLGILDGLAVSYIEKRPGTAPVPTASETRTLPAHATAMGKALLAFSGPDTLNAVINNGLDQYTPFTIVTAHGHRQAVAVARMTQVVTTRQELRLNTAAVAVPVGGRNVVARAGAQDRRTGLPAPPDSVGRHRRGPPIVP